MLRAVIVEDEMLVKLGMKMCMEQAQLGIRVSAAVSSAEEALAFFAQNEADILITDIKLTGMSGLDLLERIRERLPHMLTVVLSCYEDFSYARRAYELGADTYILKHELAEDALAGIVQELYHKKFDGGPTQHGLSALGAPRPRQQEGAAHPAGGLAFSVEGKDCYVGLLWLRAKNTSDAAYENISFPMLCETVNETMEQSRCGRAILHPNQTKVILLFSFAPDDESQRAQIDAVFRQLCSKVETYFNMDCFLYLGEPVREEESARKLYQELKRTQSWLFYCAVPGVVSPYPVPPQAEACERLTLPEPFSFSQQWEAEARAKLVQYFEAQYTRLGNPATLRVEVDRYLHAMRQTLKRDFGIAPEDVFEHGNAPSYVDIESMTHAQALLAWVLEITHTVCEAVSSGKITHPLVAKIISYARAHYAEKITLENVAEQFHINVTYFCRVFKKQTGENFVTFLNRLRIEQAIVLLNTTDMTVEQIADVVGIKTANYFFRLFKKITGKTVGHYRKG